MKKFLFILFVGCSVLSINARESNYYVGRNYLVANNNTVQNILLESNSAALTMELLAAYTGSAVIAEAISCIAKIEIQSAERFTLKSVSAKGGGTILSDDLVAMMETYIKSRALGMTRALSTERAVLMQKLSTNAASSVVGDANAQVIEATLGVPSRLILRTDDLIPVLGRSDDELDYVIYDGDVAIFFRVNAMHHTLTECMPIDRRLLTNPGLFATFKNSQKEISIQLERTIKAMDPPPNPLNAVTIARERRLYWTVVRSFFQQSRLTIIAADQATEYRRILGEK